MLLIGFMLVIAGCGSNGPVPEDVFYHLPIAAPSAQAPLASGAIRVRVMAGNSVYRDRAVLFSEGADYEIRRHRYHYWVDSPDALIQGALVDYLRASGAAASVLAADGAGADYELVGRVTGFERRVNGNSAIAHVVIEFSLARAGAAAPVLRKEYEEDAPANSGQVADSVAAFGAATGAVFRRFLEDAGSAVALNP